MILPLTSLRFIFALFVFLSHLSFLKNSPTYSNVYNNIFAEGFLGVSFFFILSGFILSLNYYNLKKEELKKFYIARIARVYPIYLLTLLVSLFFKKGSIKLFLVNLLCLQSFIPIMDVYFSFNAPSWSISTELFFYSLFPFLIFIFRNISFLNQFFIGIASFILIFFLNIFLDKEFHHYILYISPFIRIFDFILGIQLFSICRLLAKKEIKFKHFYILELLTILLFVAFFYFHKEIEITYRYSIYYWIPMCLIIFVFSSQFYLSSGYYSIFGKMFSNQILVYLGKISFCFYLLHYLVIKQFEVESFDENLKIFSIFVITLILSVILYEIVEKPMNKKIKQLGGFLIKK